MRREVRLESKKREKLTRRGTKLTEKSQRKVAKYQGKIHAKR